MSLLEDAQRDHVVVGLRHLGEPVHREDIDWLLLNRPDAFNVFTIALWELQQQKESSNLMGYYQIAGIHGLPKSYWDDIHAREGRKDKDSITFQGYCAHGTLNFGPWHRPYLALLEQTIYSKMLEIVERYPENVRPKYQEAIKTWRLPYWDYHRPRGGRTIQPGVVKDGKTTEWEYNVNIPSIFTVDQIMVRTTEADALEPHPNPFAAFTFPRVGDPQRIPDDQWENNEENDDHNSNSKKKNPNDPENLRFKNRDVTDRHIGDSGDTNPLDITLNTKREGEVEYILGIMVGDEYAKYETVGNQLQDKGASGSLEGIHGSYHNYIGGTKGTMASVAVAAFDPVFWMHHCQVDRWFAIWQAVHPESWFPLDAESQEERHSDHLPFRKTKSPETFWNADLVRDPTVFGYTYHDLDGQDSATIAKIFRENYSWSARFGNLKTNFRPAPEHMKPWIINSAQVYQYEESMPEHKIIPPLLAPSTTFNLVAAQVPIATEIQVASEEPVESEVKPPVPDAISRAFVSDSDEIVGSPDDSTVDESSFFRQWFVDVSVERLALNGEFGVYFFLGDFKEDLGYYMTQPTSVGQVYVFAAPEEGCANCKEQGEKGVLISDTVPITPMLLDYQKIGALPSLKAVDVATFLSSKLKWRVAKATGRVVNPRDIPSLQIGISSKATPINGGEPIFEQYPHIIEHIIQGSS